MSSGGRAGLCSGSAGSTRRWDTSSRSSTWCTTVGIAAYVGGDLPRAFGAVRRGGRAPRPHGRGQQRPRRRPLHGVPVGRSRGRGVTCRRVGTGTRQRPASAPGRAVAHACQLGAGGRGRASAAAASATDARGMFGRQQRDWFEVRAELTASTARATRAGVRLAPSLPRAAVLVERMRPLRVPEMPQALLLAGRLTQEVGPGSRIHLLSPRPQGYRRSRLQHHPGDGVACDGAGPAYKRRLPRRAACLCAADSTPWTSTRPRSAALSCGRWRRCTERSWPSWARVPQWWVVMLAACCDGPSGGAPPALGLPSVIATHHDAAATELTALRVHARPPRGGPRRGRADRAAGAADRPARELHPTSRFAIRRCRGAQRDGSRSIGCSGSAGT